jgi:putative methyltransferase (TIGR04325 family)
MLFLGAGCSISTGYQDSRLVENLTSNLRLNPPWLDFKLQILNTRIMELMAAIQYVLKNNKKCEIRVADVGGGNGYMGVAISKLFPEIKWEWVVYESTEIAEAYSSVLNQSNVISFAPTPELFKTSVGSVRKLPDIILISGTLQYIEYPYALLQKLLGVPVPKIVMRIPFQSTENDIVTVQDFEKIGGYAGLNAVSWPMRWFSRPKFIQYIKQSSTIDFQWVTDSESYRFMGNDIALEGLVCH